MRVESGVDEKDITSETFKGGALIQEALLEVCVVSTLSNTRSFSTHSFYSSGPLLVRLQVAHSH